MSDEYLWDRTGFPEPDELELEALLGPLGYRAASAPPRAASVGGPASSPRWLAAVFAVAACVGFGLWLVERAPEQQAIVADVQMPVDPERVPAEAEEPMAAAPAGSARRPSEIVDPWGARPSAAPRPLQRPAKPPLDESRGPSPHGIIDPWGKTPSKSSQPEADPAPPRTGHSDDLVVDPWARPSRSGDAPGSKGLSPSQIQPVVSEHEESVRSACWLPAVERAAPDATDPVRVSVSLTISSDGRVVTASPRGITRGYPGLAGCIAALAKGWSFPASDRPTTVVVPFAFSRR